jgi:hypothetical protein
VRHVENAYTAPHGVVLFEVGGVAHGHGVARKGHYFGPELLVGIVQGNGFERRGFHEKAGW